MRALWWSAYEDDELAEVAAMTDEHFSGHPEILETLSDSTRVIHGMVQLIPVTSENLFSGNLHPLFEAEKELLASTTLIRLGLYKQALSGLRSVLELGLLSVYWDASDNSHADIQNWLQGLEDTPFQSAIGKRLQTIPGVQKALEADPQLLQGGIDLFRDISGYTHSRGIAKSISGLGPRSNRPNFNAHALDTWLNLRVQVLEVVLTFHLLKYPLGLQITPLSQKFGLNTPAGGLVEPIIRDLFLRHLPEQSARLLQRLSDSDATAHAIAEKINALPDYPADAWREALLNADRSEIEMGGYESWRRNYDACPLVEPMPDIERRARLAYAEQQREWATEHDLLTLDQIVAKHRGPSIG